MSGFDLRDGPAGRVVGFLLSNYKILLKPRAADRFQHLSIPIRADYLPRRNAL